ncbi:hypothetical protein M0802_011052 [Mischocyttarus mexicanus]|nr:hypothetical protein M0802_011052 [Mischocyttarus mexicanus]
MYFSNSTSDDINTDKLLTIFFVVSHVYGEIAAMTVILDFLTIVRCIKSELERVNDLLSDINVLPCSSIALELIQYKGCKNSLKNLINVLPSSQRINSRLDVNNQIIFRSRQLLQTIRQIHLELYKVSKNMSNLYNIQTSIIISLYFFYNTCFFHSLYVSNKNCENSDRILLNELASIPHFLVSTMFKLIFINYTCDETTQKMEKINEIIYTFYAESTDNTIQQELRLYLFDNISFLVTNIIDLTFVFWVRYIKIKFSELNELLKSMLTTTVDSPQHKKVFRMKDNWEDDSSLSIIYRTYKTNENFIKLRRIKEIHLELIKCARNTNDAYGLHILMSISLAFILITAVAYNLYNHLISGRYRSNRYETFLFLHWIIYFAFKIVLISNTCAKTITEIRDFIVQLIQNPLSFTTCGFFNLDHTLITSVVSTVTTYLVILIQVGSAPLPVSVENSTSSTIDL